MASTCVHPDNIKKFVQPGNLLVGLHNGAVILVLEGKPLSEGCFCGVSIGYIGGGKLDISSGKYNNFTPKYQNNWSIDSFNPFIGKVVLEQDNNFNRF